MYISALEQFEIVPFLALGNQSLSLPNSVISFIFCILFLVYLNNLLNSRKNAYLSASRWQAVLESIVVNGIKIVKDNNGSNAVAHIPFVLIFFIFIVLAYVYGLAPYTFTLTSHLVLTFVMALTIFLAIISLSISKKGKKVFLDFLPQNTSLGLAFLLVPIEVVSFIFKPLSLSVRLFANIIAGHTLLKVICGFAWAIINAGGFLFVLHFVPLLILVLLIGLELGVALIQAYVFTILICIYLRESTEAH
jgi:ATP synthase subunit 6